MRRLKPFENVCTYIHTYIHIYIQKLDALIRAMEVHGMYMLLLEANILSQVVALIPSTISAVVESEASAAAYFDLRRLEARPISVIRRSVVKMYTSDSRDGEIGDGEEEDVGEVGGGMKWETWKLDLYHIQVFCVVLFGEFITALNQSCSQ